MTPEQIDELHLLITDKQVVELVPALDKLLPPHKEIMKLLAACRKDKDSNASTCRQLLGSAYDWLAFGN